MCLTSSSTNCASRPKCENGADVYNSTANLMLLILAKAGKTYVRKNPYRCTKEIAYIIKTIARSLLSFPPFVPPSHIVVWSAPRRRRKTQQLSPTLIILTSSWWDATVVLRVAWRCCGSSLQIHTMKANLILCTQFWWRRCQSKFPTRTKFALNFGIIIHLFETLTYYFESELYILYSNDGDSK